MQPVRMPQTGEVALTMAMPKGSARRGEPLPPLVVPACVG